MPEESTLLRRLAEAADGFRDSRPRFVVADLQFPHHVHGISERAATADSILADLATRGVTAEKFGPFRAREEPEEKVDTAEIVDSVHVFIRRGAMKRYRGDSVDALVWSLPAFDKFLVPYLTRAYGARYAAQQREWYRTKNDSSTLMKSSVVPHYRSSF